MKIICNNASLTFAKSGNVAMTKVEDKVEGILTIENNIITSPLRWHDVYSITGNGTYIANSSGTGLSNGTSPYWCAIAFLNASKEVIGGVTDKQAGTTVLTDYDFTIEDSNVAYVSIARHQYDTTSLVRKP